MFAVDFLNCQKKEGKLVLLENVVHVKTNEVDYISNKVAAI